MWKKILKTVGITAGVVVGLFLTVCTLIVWILTPARLTPLVERQASKFLMADVRADRIELTFWHTFPKMTLEVDSLSVVSRSLDALPDSVAETLPADARRLLEIGSFSGALNVPALAAGHISLYDVAFDDVAVNLLQVNDSVANYAIVPPSEEEADSVAAFAVPYVSINSFTINNARSIRFRSLRDSTDIALTLEAVKLGGSGQPVYTLSAAGGIAMPLLSDFNFDRLGFGADGSIVWRRETPLAVEFDDFEMYADELKAVVSASLDFTADPLVNSFSLKAADLPVEPLLSHCPAEYREMTEPLKTDMKLSLEMSLLRPWALGDTVMPGVEAMIDIPECKATYETLKINKFALKADVRYDFAANADNTSLDIKRFLLAGNALDVDMSVKIDRLLTDPFISGDFSGNINLSRLPARLKARVPGTVSGIVSGECDYRFALSDLNRDSFHKLTASGQLEIRDFHADIEDKVNAFAGHTVLKFGTTGSFVKDDVKVDSLLQVSLKIDTLSAVGGGVDVELRELMAGIGTVNRRSSVDTTEINPFGGRINVGLLKFVAIHDSLRFWLRNPDIKASLRRYKGEKRLPVINMNASMDGLLFGQKKLKVAVKSPELDVSMHMRPKRDASARRKHLADSLGISVDSLVRRFSSAVVDTMPAMGDIDFALSGEERNILRRWDLSGSLRAAGGVLVVPSFPVRNSLKNIDLSFSTDSIKLRNMLYRAGGSDFLVNGSISNLRRALLSRRRRTPVDIDFSVISDSINVNQIVNALFSGTSASPNDEIEQEWGDLDIDRGNIDNAQTDSAGAHPLLVPRNIDARLKVRADRVLYSDLQMSDFHGDVLVFDGAVNLRNLGATTDVGTIALNGLYSAPDPEDMQFGLGMKVDRFRLDRLNEIVPAIDSLMPMLKEFSGIVNADVAVTTDIDRNMDINIPSLKAAIKIEGDSLVLLDADTFKSLSKWLMFKNKKRNMIDHMTVEAVIENSTVELYPFMFNIDRYRLGVMGSNDMAMNMNYHVSVLKSPIPFKFGINIKGTPEKMKIKVGGAKFKDNMVIERQAIADNTRINLVQQIDKVFRKGVTKARLGRLQFSGKGGKSNAPAMPATPSMPGFLSDDALSPADSLRFIQQGLIENPDSVRFPVNSAQ